MPGLDKDRKRNVTIAFRVTPEEKRQLDARIAICGKPRGRFYIESLLTQEIKITLGKYQSDRLSLELRKLRECLGELKKSENSVELIEDCMALLNQLKEITDKTNQKRNGEYFER